MNTSVMRLRRISKGLTQAMIAQSTGVDISTVCRCELGQLPNTPRTRTIQEAIARELGVSPTALFPGAGPFDEAEG